MIFVACGIIPVAKEDQKETNEGFKTFIYALFIISGLVNGFGASIIWVG